jgi:hypothetical protein
MKRKTRKFAEGGFSAAQEEWLTRGGQSPDRTDPYILARMRSAVPDEVAPKNTSRDFDAIDEDMVAPSRNLTAPVTVTKTKTSVTAAPKTASKPEVKQAPAMPAEEKARMENLVKKQKLETVTPEEMLIGGGSLKVLRTAGKKLADKIASGRTKTYSQAEFDAMTPKLSGPSASSKTPALPSPTPKLPYDKAGAMAKKRAERAEAREEDMRKENAGRYGVTDFSAPGFGSLRDKMMKKGGKVSSYKSGGSVKTSASKRADGCAIRGKTRA